MPPLPSAVSHGTEPGDLSDENIKAIQEHIWNKYVEGTHDEFDEAAALETLAEFHRTHSPAVAPDTYYLGILYFEMAYEQATEGERNLFLARASTILQEYVDRTKDDIEDIVDRLEDAGSQVEGLPDAVRKPLLERVVKELSQEADDRKKAEAEAAPSYQVVDGMVLVPGGSFLSGPAKTAKDSKPFWIDVHPVTNAEYLRFVESTGYRSPKFWTEGRLREPNAPVVGISWYDAYKYAASVGKSLATKDQWEKAARGKGGRLYPWGDEFVADNACHAREDGSDAIEAVEGRPGNVSEYGVRDMVGNVWQWTESPDPGDPEQRVICGGSWCDPAAFLRCDTHLSAYPKDKYDNIGFRCVRLAKE
jgi:formylglycine-generating enzyme required for sulfatase activity